MIPACNCNEGGGAERVAVCDHREGGGSDGMSQERFFHFVCAMAVSFSLWPPFNFPYLFSIANFEVGTMACFFLELKSPTCITKYNQKI
jgi:hypothetical protein